MTHELKYGFSRFIKSGVAASAICATAATMPTALAQSEPEQPNAEADNDTLADASEVKTLDVVTVNARRREENIQTVPVAVSSFSPEALEQRGVVTTQDLTFVTPGLVVAPALSRDVPAFVIRGQQRQADGTGSPAVLTYFADVPLSTQGSILPTFDVASVQVLKGPQGTLFGRNTTGGAVLLYPEAPDYEFGGYASMSLGEFNHREFEGALNIPLIEDKLALRIAGQDAERDGYTENLGVGDDLDDRNTSAYRASLLFEPNDFITNTLIGDYYEAKEAGTGAVLTSVYPNEVITDGGVGRGPLAFLLDSDIPGLDVDLNLAAQQENGIRTVNPDFEPRSDREIWGVTNTTEIDLGTVSLKNIIAYRSTFIDSSRDFDGTPAPINGQAGIVSTDQFTNEFQIFGTALDDKLDYLFGAFYLKEEPDGANTGTSTIFFGPSIAELFFETESQALFVDGSYALDDFVPGLTFNAGFRYTWDEIVRCNATVADASLLAESFSGCKQDNPGNVTTTESSAPTWSFGFDYELNDDVFLYIASRRGYRGAGPNGTGFTAFPELENFEEETVTDVEVGLKSSFDLGGADVTFNIAGYLSEFEDIQRTIITPATIDVDGDGDIADNPFTLVVNAAKATINGVEADASVGLNDYVTVGGFVNYTDAGFDEFEVIPELLAAINIDPESSVFTYVPEFTAGLYLNVAYPLGEIGDLSFDANLYHSDEVNFNGRPNDPAATEDGYDLVNVRLGLESIAGSNVNAGIFVRNLFDEEYKAAPGFAVPTFTTATSVFGEPRMFGAEIKVDF
ncbi:MAG: TonB-dependent receptor [Pseudomonadota bacterium]